MMNKLITLLVIALTVVGLVWAGTVRHDPVTYSNSAYTAIDTIEIDTSDTFEIGDGKNLPVSLRFLTRTITSIDSVDTVYTIINMDVSYDGSVWYDYCDVDTVEVDTQAAQTNYHYSDAITVPPFRYARFRTSNATNCSTITMYHEKLIEFADGE